MISIILAVYNSATEMVEFSLRTFFAQSYRDFEIVVADDCSRVDITDTIRNIFKENHFENYQIIRNEKNQGTVRNILGAAAISKGEYIKTFGAGDGFYQENSLQKMVDYIKRTKCECGFANMKMYSAKSGAARTLGCPFPFPFGIYDFEKQRNIERNLILFKDNASGAAMWYRRDILIKYLESAVEYIKYMEDICQLEIILNGHSVNMFSECLFLYEGDMGISTGSGFSQRLYNDEMNYYEYLTKKYPENKWLNKRKKYNKVFAMKNARLRCIVLAIICPGQLSLLLQRYKGLYLNKKYGDNTCDAAFLR